MAQSDTTSDMLASDDSNLPAHDMMKFAHDMVASIVEWLKLVVVASGRLESRSGLEILAPPVASDPTHHSHGPSKFCFDVVFCFGFCSTFILNYFDFIIPKKFQILLANFASKFSLFLPIA